MERIDRNNVLREDLNEKDASPSFSLQAKRFGKRHVLVVLGMLGFANVYALRVNLSVALVAMVNSTFANANSEANSRECSTDSSSSDKVILRNFISII